MGWRLLFSSLMPSWFTSWWQGRSRHITPGAFAQTRRPWWSSFWLIAVTCHIFQDTSDLLYICIKMLFQMREFPNCKLCVKGVSRLWRTTFQHWWCNWLNQNLGKIDTRMKDFDLTGLLWSGFLNNLRSALEGFWSIATFFIKWHYYGIFYILM